MQLYHEKEWTILLIVAFIFISCCSNNVDNQDKNEIEADSVEILSIQPSDLELTEERFQELVASIPDHGIQHSPASSFSSDYYLTLQQAWKIPDGGLGGIGNGEFLYYFVCGNDPCDTHSGKLKAVSITGDTAFVKFDIIHSQWGEPQNKPHTFKLVVENGQWVIADYDQTLQEMKDYLKTQTAYLRSKAYHAHAQEILNDTEAGEEWKSAVRNELGTVEEYFRAMRPIACIGSNINGGTWSKDILLANPQINLKTSDGQQWKVICYKVAFVKGDEKSLSYILVNGPRFSEPVVRGIREASSGTRMLISDIKVRSDVGEWYSPDFSVTLK